MVYYKYPDLVYLGGNDMKRFLAVLLTVALCFSFTACGDSLYSGSGGNKVYGINQTAELKTLKFTATELSESNGEDFFEPEEGNVFVGIKFTVENISDEEQSVSSLLLFEGYVDDIKCDYSISAACVFDEGTLDGSIAPGKKLVGWYALEVPSDWSVIELEVQSNWITGNSAKFKFEK